jgi:hypothetical protein
MGRGMINSRTVHDIDEIGAFVKPGVAQPFHTAKMKLGQFASGMQAI